MSRVKKRDGEQERENEEWKRKEREEEKDKAKDNKGTNSKDTTIQTLLYMCLQFLTQATQEEIQRIRSGALTKKKAIDQMITEKIAETKVRAWVQNDG